MDKNYYLPRKKTQEEYMMERIKQKEQEEELIKEYIDKYIDYKEAICEDNTLYLQDFVL